MTVEFPIPRAWPEGLTRAAQKLIRSGGELADVRREVAAVEGVLPMHWGEDSAHASAATYDRLSKAGARLSQQSRAATAVGGALVALAEAIQNLEQVAIRAQEYASRAGEHNQVSDVVVRNYRTAAARLDTVIGQTARQIDAAVDLVE